MAQAISPSANVTHVTLADGFRLCFLAPYLATIVNSRTGERQCTYVGFSDRSAAEKRLALFKHRAILRQSKYLPTNYEIEIWGLNTEELMSLWRQISPRKQ